MNVDREALKVVLVSPRNPLNIGAAARAMSNFGFNSLRLVNAYEVAYQEARSAVNASAVLARTQQYATVADAIADCAVVVGTTSVGPRALRHSLRRLEFAGGELRRDLSTGPVALLFGSEKFGLSNDDLSYCHWLLRIPTRDEHHSMNLGQAVAVCLYEIIRRDEEESRQPLPVRRAPAADTERLAEVLIEALRESGYTQDASTDSAEIKVRRLIRRLELGEADVHVGLGMLRQMLWRMRQR